MNGEFEILKVLKRHEVRFVIVGSHAVTFHGYQRVTQGVDVVWQRSAASERSLLAARTEINGEYIGREIDPTTGIERTHAVSGPFICSSHLMMLCTSLGFLDLFDYVPGLPNVDVGQLFSTSFESGGLRFASLEWLREMKKASGRPKDPLDLQNLPGGEE